MAIEKSYIDMLKERDVKIEALIELLKLSHGKLGSQSDMIADLDKDLESCIAMLENFHKNTGSLGARSLVDKIRAKPLRIKALKEPS
jgi:hypothetical protein